MLLLVWLFYWLGVFFIMTFCVWFGAQKNNWGKTSETCRGHLNSPCSTRSCSTAASNSALWVWRQGWTQQGIQWVCNSALQNQPQNLPLLVPNHKGCICAKEQTQTGHQLHTWVPSSSDWVGQNQKLSAGCFALWIAVCVSIICFTVFLGVRVSQLDLPRLFWPRECFVCPACSPSTGLVWHTWLCCSGDVTRFHVRVNTGRHFVT